MRFGKARNAQYCPVSLAVMFAGVEILNENNHGTKGQNVADFSVPEIQVSCDRFMEIAVS
jgi:hypothetical protein